MNLIAEVHIVFLKFVMVGGLSMEFILVCVYVCPLLVYKDLDLIKKAKEMNETFI